ncbi:uncharacterized protein I303_108168 [Kwoniella dejecticola CBS 10117]|uniref:Uncharacterized protein n=1 Tax=Kwoniella dejecticola CBS 10117 TaxID=1296121 RepID=A0A1A5ZY52_9TREE|nr:uncharacterized protein I303_07506 [Kwoniella dejecticola CBS 10117]OBR82739.1 hypothetical protein I303_07506 [Kwoniella dejecticola CBS 10117]
MDPEDWRRVQPLMFTPYNPPPAPVDIPYEHANPFSPYVFPRYGWYHPEVFSQIDLNPPAPNPGKSQATGKPVILPTQGVYDMYTRDPTLLPKTWTGPWNDPSNTKAPVHKPFGDASDLTWTSPRTGKTYQLPAMPDRYEGEHHYECEKCRMRKMKFDGFLWCKQCRDNTKNIAVKGP